MKQNYQYFKRKQLETKTEELLAVAIMDTGTKEELEKSMQWYVQNFDHALHVITYSDRFVQSRLPELYPSVSFIVFDRIPSLAKRINALANECMTSFFYVTRTDVDTVAFDWNSMYGKLIQDEKLAVLSPLVFNKNQELIPTVNAPGFNKNDIDPISFMPSRGNDQNLYPFLGLGIYKRSIFQRMRGFDDDIKGAFWQVVDFGTRCWLYGYNIYSVNDVAIIFPDKLSLIEDRTDCEGIERFYTKALGVVITRNGSPKLNVAYRTDKNMLMTEVKQKSALYKTDFQTLCTFWKNPEDN